MSSMQKFCAILLIISLAVRGTAGFHPPQRMSMTSHTLPNETTKQLYNVKGSGWSSPNWNWGSAAGTGHDCAAICRRRWGDQSDRRKLVESLLHPAEFKASRPESEVPFEEVKLVLGLAWQRGRWDGSDGGPGGYAEVLNKMASAHRYENDDEVISALNFIEDVSAKFQTIGRGENLARMKGIAAEIKGRDRHQSKEEIFMERRMCAGMILDAMNFVENGL